MKNTEGNPEFCSFIVNIFLLPDGGKIITLILQMQNIYKIHLGVDLFSLFSFL